MRAARRIVAVLAVASLGAPAVASAQGAGDNQYQDPFPSSGSTSARSTAPTDRPATSSTSRQGTTLSPTPPSTSTSRTTTSGSSGSTTTTRSTGATSTGSATARSTSSATSLARTGLDASALALLGMGLLLTGIGLRLRVVDERRAP